MTVRLTALVSGRVQGVGFRYWVRRQAERLGVQGMATNLRDGRVEVTAEGERGACEKLLDALGGGAAPGYVADVAASWTDATGEYRGFRER